MRTSVSQNEQMADRVEALEREIESLSEAEYQRLATWFLNRDAELWDKQLALDSEAGRLDFLIDEVDQEERAGSLTNLFDGI